MNCKGHGRKRLQPDLRMLTMVSLTCRNQGKPTQTCQYSRSTEGDTNPGPSDYQQGSANACLLSSIRICYRKQLTDRQNLCKNMTIISQH
jgi:hypothetical protein